jgi:hypothetical protein
MLPVGAIIFKFLAALRRTRVLMPLCGDLGNLPLTFLLRTLCHYVAIVFRMIFVRKNVLGRETPPGSLFASLQNVLRKARCLQDPSSHRDKMFLANEISARSLVASRQNALSERDASKIPRRIATKWWLLLRAWCH